MGQPVHDVKDLSQPGGRGKLLFRVSSTGEREVGFSPFPALPSRQKSEPQGRAGLSHGAADRGVKAAHVLWDTAELPGRTPHSWALYRVLGNHKQGLGELWEWET